MVGKLSWAFKDCQSLDSWILYFVADNFLFKVFFLHDFMHGIVDVVLLVAQAERIGKWVALREDL